MENAKKLIVRKFNNRCWRITKAYTYLQVWGEREIDTSIYINPTPPPPQNKFVAHDARMLVLLSVAVTSTVPMNLFKHMRSYIVTCRAHRLRAIGHRKWNVRRIAL